MARTASRSSACRLRRTRSTRTGSARTSWRPQRLANHQDGIRIDGAASTVIGGVDGLARNVIGGNGQHGIGIYSSATGAARLGTQIVGNTIGFRSPPNTVGNGLSGIHLGSATNTIIGGETPGRDQPDLAERPQRRDGARRHRQPDHRQPTASPTTRSWASISATTASPRTTPATAIPGRTTCRTSRC